MKPPSLVFLNCRNTQKLLSRISGQLEVMIHSYVHKEMFERVAVLLSGWESVLQALPELSYSPDDMLDPWQIFLQRQVRRCL